MKAILASISGALVSLALAGPAFAAPQDMAAVCQNAASEEPLIWYSGQEPTRDEAVIKAFNQEYPKIQVNYLRLVSGRLSARYAAEKSAGAKTAGLVTVADPAFFESGFEKGWLAEFSKSNFPSLQRMDDRWFNRGAAVSVINMLGISYNTKLTAGHVPKTWQDLIDPRYKGTLILGDPRTVPSYMALAHIWRQKLGDDFLKKLAAQQPVWVASVVSSTQQLAAGELPVVAPNVRTVVSPLKNEGAPIDFIEPSLTTGVEFVTAVSKTTESPNAARCLYNFLFTKPGQVAFAFGDSYSAFGSLDGGTPLPTEYVSPVAKEVEADAPTILALLGLQ